MKDLLTRIRAMAVRLSARGTRLGHVGANTKRTADELRRELVARFNAELDTHTTTEFFKTERYDETEDGKYKERLIPDNEREPVSRSVPNAKGEILQALLEHLVSGAFGNPSHSPTERENRILAAAKALIELCDGLELKSDSSVPSPIENANEGTTEGTKNSETADTDDISEKESEIVRHWCELCQKMKSHWFNAIKKAGKDIPRQTFFKQFFERPKLPAIWIDSGWSGMMKKFKANENQWLVEYENLKTSLRKADT